MQWNYYHSLSIKRFLVYGRRQVPQQKKKKNEKQNCKLIERERENTMIKRRDPLIGLSDGVKNVLKFEVILR